MHDLRAVADGSAHATLTLADGLAVFLRVDDFTDPWTEPETIVLLHGVAEASEAWFAWIPHLARHYRVLRPDMRGFGRTTPMPLDHHWSLDELSGDLLAVLDHLGLAAPHIVAAKVAGMVGLHFAAQHPSRVATLTVIGNPVRGSDVTAIPGYGADTVERHGVAYWAALGQASRLGSSMPPQAHDWWTAMMGRTAASTQAGFLRSLGRFDATPALERIMCPTLVVTSGASAGTSSSITSEAAVRAWQSRIPRSRLCVLASDSYHVAASDADRAAPAVRAFIEGARRV